MLGWLWARGRTVSFADWLVLGEAFALLCAARVALAVVPVRRLVGVGGAGGTGDAGRVRWAVESVARRSPVRFVCFPQCLAAEWMLRRRGIGSVLHYGVRRDEAAGGKLLAHTWLECGGNRLIGEGEGFAGFEEGWRGGGTPLPPV